MPESNSLTLDKIYSEIVNSGNEIKLLIEASETRILQKIEGLETRIGEIEKENQILRNKLKQIEKSSRRNNIVIFGLNKSQQVTPEYICQEISKLLDISLESQDVNNVYPLGRSEKSPIKVEFISYQKKTINFQKLQKTKRHKNNNLSRFNKRRTKRKQDFEESFNAT